MTTSYEAEPRLAAILGNGAQGWAPNVRLRAPGDHLLLELLKIEQRSCGKKHAPYPALYGRIISAVSEGEPFADTHGVLVLTSKRLRALLDDFDPQIGDTVAVQVVNAGRTALYRYGVERARPETRF